MTTLHAEAVGKRTWPQYLGWGLFLVLLAWAWELRATLRTAMAAK